MSLKPTDNGPYVLLKRFRHDEEFSRVPKKMSWKKNVLNFDEGTTFGRTPLNWLVMLAFFVVFYACLMLFWLINYNMYASMRNDTVPTQLMHQPGMSYAPCIIDDGHRKIVFHEMMTDSVTPYVNALEDFVQKVDPAGYAGFGPCTLANEFGFDDLEPCIILKINRAIGFKVDTYNASSMLPDEAPAELAKYMDTLTAEERMHRIWLSCSSDMKPDNIGYKYFPNRFIEANATVSAQKHPNSKDDFGRMVAVKLTGLPKKKEISFKCFMWAKNIKMDEHNVMGVGMVQFAVKILPKVRSLLQK